MVFRLLVLVILLSLIGLSAPRLITAFFARHKVATIDQVQSTQVAIVFGAGLWRDGSPTPVLRDRVATAAELYFAGKVRKLLMSGDNSRQEYNEPAAMRDYALSLGVPEEDIVLDFAGRRTYDTCYRARDIFGVQEAILITQSFHMPRALYLCNFLGISATGVASDRQDYHRRSVAYWNLREVPATLVALWEVHVSRPVPILGNPEPIFPLEAQ